SEGRPDRKHAGLRLVDLRGQLPDGLLPGRLGRLRPPPGLDRLLLRPPLGTRRLTQRRQRLLTSGLRIGEHAATVLKPAAPPGCAADPRTASVASRRVA